MSDHNRTPSAPKLGPPATMSEDATPETCGRYFSIARVNCPLPMDHDGPCSEGPAAVFILFRTEYETYGLPVAAHPTLDAAKADAEVREHGKRLKDRSYSWEVDKGAYWPWKTPRNWELRPTRKNQEHWWTIYQFALSPAHPSPLHTPAKEEEERVAELESVFGHIHESGEIKGWISDKCAKCGLDLRDQIHTRGVSWMEAPARPEVVDPA